MKEYIGYKDLIGEGLYNMGLTNEEIIRCRDCKHSHKLNGLRCSSYQWRNQDEPPEVDPDGFCAWAERDE